MNNSKPGQKLTPSLKAIVEPIYRRNPKRYARLILWIWHHQRLGWEDEAIGEALRLAGPHLDMADDYWKYLTSLMRKAKAAAVAKESDNHKSADMAIAKEFVEFLKARAK